MSAQAEFTELARTGGRGALVTNLEDGAKVLIRTDGSREGTLGDPVRDEEAAKLGDELMWAERAERHGDLFVDVTFPPPRLIVFGAVDFAAALCKMAKATGWRAFVVDPRARFAQPARFPDAEQVVAAWPEEAFQQLGGIDRATAIAVLTHDPKLDDAALVLALRSDAGYIGAMGSRRAQAKRRERLLAKGIEDSDLERISAPIGLDLGALTAEETALSIIGEIVAMRHGRGGGRLAQAQGRIHEVGV
ncbi:MAG TPA: XdhC family protein [Solirubrobacteraceae bacterium]|nr:XdhC family protein [Solirubrobacteraceae bacterium]